MEIIQCPVCHRTGGGLHFKPARPGTRSYPYVRHYGQKAPCNISPSNLSKIEFRDPKFNAWKSVVKDLKEWHKIESLASRYSSIDSYRHKTDIQKIEEEFLDVMNQEIIWMKKCTVSKKHYTAFTYDGHIVQMPDIPSTIPKLDYLMKRVKELHRQNNDPNILLCHYMMLHARMQASIIRKDVIKLVPLEMVSRKRKLTILDRKKRTVLPDFDPKTRDESLWCHFHGTQCTECKSWRTDLAPDATVQCICYACGKTGIEAGIRPYCLQCHNPFYDSVIREMIKNAVDNEGNEILTRCYYCNEEVPFSRKHVEMFSTLLS